LHRILLVARRDYLATIRTKAFLVGLVVAPILFGGGFLGVALLKAKPDVKDRHIAIVDRTGVSAEAIIQAAGEKGDKDFFDKLTGRQVQPRYLFETIPADDRDPAAQRLTLSDRVRSGQLYAFVEIKSDAIHPAADSKSGTVACYTNATAFDDIRNWLDGRIGEGIHRVRMSELGIDPSHFREVLASVPVERFGLVSRDRKTGAIGKAEKKNPFDGIAAPFVLVLLLGMIVLSGSTPILTSITEDKAQRIVEMLVGLATPFELMMGKVLAAVGVSLTSSSLYVVGGSLALTGLGMVGMVPFHLLPWFYVYLVADVVMLCAFAAALGAGCSSPQDAQSLAVVLVAPVMIPYFLLMPIIEQPNGAIATVISLIPPFTPMVMLMRQAMPGGVPGWQPWVGLVAAILWTLASVWVAARIFRVGILMQGKSPKFAELVRWAVRG
jgi:ABC-type Na+ efflux pump permease subunit